VVFWGFFRHIMLFNSIEYAFFLPIVFVLYWLLSGRYKIQNILLLVSSYLFYGWWDWRFLMLIAFTSFCSWGSGLMIQNSKRSKGWLAANIVVNLLILALFKYYNFFITSFADLFHLQCNSLLLNIVLPVGISFYTFQALSYNIDVYRHKIEPTRDIIVFFTYVSFFPQLVAGPIERATNLLPQFLAPRCFNCEEAFDGLRRILWGLFKKIVIADNCAMYVDYVWQTYSYHNGSTVLLAAILFSFQIYCDFSGYSDIAIGSARLFGIRLKDNFRMPYLSRSVAEFWKRWHISLNTWFVDYVYIPLGGSRHGQYRTIVNTFAIFLLSGLWHGANWTFVLWGVYSAFLFVPLMLLGKTKKYHGVPKWQELPQIILTFCLVAIGWIIFRAPNIENAWEFFTALFNHPFTAPMMRVGLKRILVMVSLLIVVEWFMRHREHALDIAHFPAVIRYLIYYALILLILEYGADSQSFIYFQF